MKLFTNHVHALLLMAAVGLCVPAYAMESEVVDAYVLDEQFDQQNEEIAEEVVCKKYSVKQVACAAVICAVAAYAVAIRMNKVASPFAFWTSLYGQKTTSIVDSITNDTVLNDGADTTVTGQAMPSNDNPELVVVVVKTEDNAAQVEEQAVALTWVLAGVEKVKNFSSEYKKQMAKILSEDKL